MLTEKRYAMILELVEKRRSVTVPEIKEILGVSESTIRRDLTALDRAGKLSKVFGGAVAVDTAITVAEPSVAQKMEMQQAEKRAIARYAASLITDSDFIFLDAGTTTGCLIDCIYPCGATFVTNAVSHARRLAMAGFRVILVGGELKGTTEAVVGSQAILTLENYHFTKGFFGTNGISRRCGFTTPDTNEALVKQTAINQSAKSYVLADSQKFGSVSSVTFAPYEKAVIITETEPPEPFHGNTNILVAK